MMNHPNVLIIEDEEKKYLEVLAECNEFFLMHSCKPNITRVSNIIEAEDAIEDKMWDLVILDISMNINGSSISNFDGNQADLAGLELAETMYLLSCVFPTIVITGFDYFKVSDITKSSDSFLYLEQLKKQIRKYLGELLYGTVRYGKEQWEEEFKKGLESWKESTKSG